MEIDKMQGRFGHVTALLIVLVVFMLGSVTYAAKGGDDKQKAKKPVRNELPLPVTDEHYYDNGAPSPALVSLGAQLFFDKLLSGNQNISCATCHHSLAGTGDGLALPVGEGGRGLGVTRDTGVGADAIHERVPRNAPPIFNLGAREFKVLFHDGRAAVDDNHVRGFVTPAGAELPEGLNNLLAAQAMFPVTSGTEMAGQAGENPIADAAAAGDLSGPNGVWAQLAERIRGIDGYVSQFEQIFEDVNGAEDIEFVHAANAIAAFESVNWRADNSPFDRYLRGEKGAMSSSAKRGMRVFYNPSKGNCAACHSGPFQTDHSFRAIAMPQVGPGKGDGASGREDFGREKVTGNPVDRYKFRVPTLRNVAVTAPYGHAGSFDSLESIVRHHLNAESSLYEYDSAQLMKPSRPDLDEIDLVCMDDPQVLANIAAANELPPRHLSEQEFSELIDFLNALTDFGSLDLRSDVPRNIPSGNTLAE